jgi:aspartate-semialdehyde dehydrogenase
MAGIMTTTTYNRGMPQSVIDQQSRTRSRHLETLSVAVVGATGMVGSELLRIVEQRRMQFRELRLLASARSAGQSIALHANRHEIREMSERALEGVDLAFFAAGGSISREFAPRAAERGTIVIDKSSAFRMDPGVPLVIPEINGSPLNASSPSSGGIIAVPNCTTIITLMAVTPLHRAVGIERMVVSTYQAASGAGAAGVEELERQARDFAAGRPITPRKFKSPYMFNLFSHDSPIDAAGENDEEAKLRRETHKIWGDDSVKIAATCVRVPVLRCHAASINLTLKSPLGEDAARDLIGAFPGVRIVDDRAGNRFPEPVDATGEDDVLVGRIRADQSQAPGMGLNLFVCGDQVRKGAALNAVQIAEWFFDQRPR